jgi:hypothetical protein
MTPFYDLWDVEVGTSLGTYETEDEVLAVVRALLLAQWDAYAEALQLGFQDAAGEWREISSGAALADLAMATTIATRE